MARVIHPALVTGLPDDCDADEVKEAFSKCGVIKIDPESHAPRIKLYVDKTSGMLKERPS